VRLTFSKYTFFTVLFYFGFASFLFGLSVSKVIVSVAQFLMAFAWLMSGDLKQKAITGFKNTVFISMGGIFIIHLLGMLYSDNWTYGIHDIRTKLPLLVIPFMFAGFNIPDKKYINYIFYLFFIGLIVGCVGALVLYAGLGDKEITDARYLSPFVSHIRFSILLVIGIISCACLYALNKQKWLWIAALFFIANLFILKAMTGWILLLVALLFYVWQLQLKYRILFFSMLIGLIAVSGLMLHQFYNRVFTLSSLHQEQTIANKKGYTNYDINEIENGEYVWKNINDSALTKEWKKISNTSLTEKDKRKQPLRNTLLRYLTSKHYTKDSAGISALSILDIYNIKNGYTNYLFINPNSLDYKIYQLLYELHTFLQGSSFNGHSLSMRYLLAKTGIEIWKDNFLIGVGTGDVQDAFDWKYEHNKTELSKENHLRAHNQFITFGLTFGAVGFICIFFLLLRLFKNQSRIFKLVYFILLLSFLNEDTLETQIGVSMFIGVFFLFTLLDKMDAPCAYPFRSREAL